MKTDEINEDLTLEEALRKLEEYKLMNRLLEVSSKELQVRYSKLYKECNEQLLYREKLEEVREVIDNNLFSIFTAFTLDLELDSRVTLQQFVKLKELLGIDRGIGMNAAIEYDNFKYNRPNEYRQIMDTLDLRISHMKRRYSDVLGYSTSSTYMFMSAFYITHINQLSEDMSIEEVDRIIRNIGSYNFTSG